jgi:hypothetical protein
MGNKILLHLLALGLFAGAQSRPNPTAIRGISNETDEDRYLRRGLKLFKFPDGFTCWARNQKSADRKHNNTLKNNNHEHQ